MSRATETPGRDETVAPTGAQRSGEEAIYRFMSTLLLAGVAASVALMLGGLAVLAARHSPVLDPHGAVRAWLPLREVLPHVLAGDPRGLLDLGVLLLFLTPILRVVAAVGLFAAQGHYRSMAVACGVFGLLSLSLLLAP